MNSIFIFLGHYFFILFISYILFFCVILSFWNILFNEQKFNYNYFWVILKKFIQRKNWMILFERRVKCQIWKLPFYSVSGGDSTIFYIKSGWTINMKIIDSQLFNFLLSQQPFPIMIWNFFFHYRTVF